MTAPFAQRLLAWHARHGRHDLPWQHPRTPYRVWLSEIMLQQTQVTTVIPYFERFLARFPDVTSLAQAPIDDVLALWAGLGYYARARNLHRCAQQVAERHGGEFPTDLAAMEALPGIGRSTAAAILAQAYGLRHAILDGNVKRVLARHAGVDGWSGVPAVQKRLWREAEARLPQTRLADYTQAIMDLGASVCRTRRPQCPACPLRSDCVAVSDNRVAELPAARPRRARPRREAQLLLIENAAGELLLERRPPAGIWGGLWCPPVLEPGADFSAVCRARYGLTVSAAAALPPLQHAFTHFELTLQPLRMRAAPVASAVNESAPLLWTRMDALHHKGLPAPIRKLLQARASLFETLECPAPSTA